MHKIDSNTAQNGSFVTGNASTGTKATQFTADWCNAVQNEICNVITGAGATLNKNSNNQLKAAVETLAADYAAVSVVSAETASATAKRDTSANVSGSSAVVVNYGATLDASVSFNVTSSVDCYLYVKYEYSSVGASTTSSSSVSKKVRINSGVNYINVRILFRNSSTSYPKASGSFYVNIASGTGVDTSTSVALSDICFDATLINSKR